MSDATKAVFLSYAREDSEAARRIADALRAAGVEVWFDQSELRGGDAWDHKIRRQIKECALFVPVISQRTDARREGYFRREWKLAIDRTHDRDDDLPFLVPVVIDDTTETSAHVPDKLREVQWTRLAAGDTSPEFAARVRKLLGLEGARGPCPPEPSAKAGAPPSTNSEAGETQSSYEATAGKLPALRQRRGFPRWAWAAIVVAVLGGGSAWLWLRSPTGETTTARTPPSAAPTPGTPPSTAAKPPLDFASEKSTKSIAVLAFENLSGDKENEYFSDGVSEELLNVLGRVPDLRVAARTSAFSFKGSKSTAQEIGQKLGVAHLVEGSVRRAGTKVRIAARLSRADTGEQVWGESYEKELKDIFALQDEIAREVAQKLQLKLGGARHATKVVNPEAHQLVLEGRHFWNLKTDDGFNRAASAFNRALQIDPQYAPAHAGRGVVAMLRAHYRQLEGYGNTSGHWTQSRADSERALELEPEMAEPHATLAYLLWMQGKLGAAETEGRQAAWINPNYAVARLVLGDVLQSQGRLDEALAELEQGVRLDPLDLTLVSIRIGTIVCARRFQEALDSSQRAAALRSDMFPPLLGARAASLLALGRHSEAVESARALLDAPTVQPRWWYDPEAIRVLVQAERRAEANQYADLISRSWPKDSYLRGFLLAALGRFEEARPFLENTPGQVFWQLYWSPIFDPYRSDPRFDQLMAKLGCAKEYKVAREALARMLHEQEAKK